MVISVKDTDERHIDLLAVPESNGGTTLYITTWSKGRTRQVVSSLIHLTSQEAAVLGANFPRSKGEK